MHLAALSGNVKVLETLLEEGADKDIVDRWGKTPLHKAVESGNLQALGVLTRNGASLKVVDPAGELCKAADKEDTIQKSCWFLPTVAKVGFICTGMYTSAYVGTMYRTVTYSLMLVVNLFLSTLCAANQLQRQFTSCESISALRKEPLQSAHIAIYASVLRLGIRMYQS
eukprot:scaffold179611_cov23-Prasinocladus_malaysianus.AAC.1